jgi:branched-chain amino acid transport system ATP-binding protein
MTISSFLEVDDIEALYGQALLALRGVSLRVEQGSIVALLGANGAGKTTTLKAISNLLPSERGSLSRGTITWRGQTTRHLHPADLVAKGVVQVLEGRHVFPQLTV